MTVSVIQLLLLIVVANGAPILLARLNVSLLNVPLDAGKKFFDGRRLLGDSKTWRGIIGAMILTAIVSAALGYGFLIGVRIAVLAMLGDLISSFIKRRFGIASSNRAPFLDQIPESLLPALGLRHVFDLNMLGIATVVFSFIVVEIFLQQFF